MTTTAVFAEILVVGLETEAWLTMLVLAIFGPDVVDLSRVHNWTTLLTFLILAAAYLLGVMVDSIADAVVLRLVKRLQKLERLQKRLEELRGPAPPESIVPFARMRMEVLHKSDGMAKFLDYQRSRQRLARGTIVNAACAIPCAIALLNGSRFRSAGSFSPLSPCSC